MPWDQGGAVLGVVIFVGLSVPHYMPWELKKTKGPRTDKIFLNVLLREKFAHCY